MATARTFSGGGIGAEEVPGLLEFGVFGFGAMRGEKDLGLSASGVEGNDVPDLDGDDVSRDKVEHAFAVRDSVGVDVTFVSSGGVVAASGFDLHTQEVSVVLDGNVVGRGVSPGTDDGEALLGGAGHEEKLGPFSALFEMFDDVGGVVWHEGSRRDAIPPCRKNGDKGGATRSDENEKSRTRGPALSFARRKSTYLKHSKVSRGIVPNFQKYIWGVLLGLRGFGMVEGLDKNFVKIKFPTLSQKARQGWGNLEYVFSNDLG